MTEERTAGPITVTVDGFDTLEKVLSPSEFRRMAKIVLLKIAKEVKVQAIPYPSEGPWNQPGPYPARWYQRQFGSRWALKGGGTGGNSSSERMQKLWVITQKGPWQVSVGNRASYAPYVMGEEQRSYHEAHGWKKLKEIGAEESRKGPRIMEEELEKSIQEHGGGAS